MGTRSTGYYLCTDAQYTGLFFCDFNDIQYVFPCVNRCQRLTHIEVYDLRYLIILKWIVLMAVSEVGPWDSILFLIQEQHFQDCFPCSYVKSRNAFLTGHNKLVLLNCTCIIQNHMDTEHPALFSTWVRVIQDSFINKTWYPGLPTIQGHDIQDYYTFGYKIFTRLSHAGITYPHILPMLEHEIQELIWRHIHVVLPPMEKPNSGLLPFRLPNLMNSCSQYMI